MTGMRRRTACTVGHRRVQYGPKTERGVRTRTWAPPEPLRVSSWMVGSSTEPTEPGRTAVVVESAIHALPGTVVDPHDRFVIDGEEFEVDGEPLTGARNPFTRRATGVVIKIRRVTG